MYTDTQEPVRTESKISEANCQYANAGCNGYFYCKPEKNPQVNELIVAPNLNASKIPHVSLK